jgi:glutathione S-transferase
MLALYHAPQSRSSRFVWLLEEIGAPCELRIVSIPRGDTGAASAEYRRIHPYGKVPALVHDGALILESAAIALYLADAFPEAGLGPRLGDPLARGPFLPGENVERISARPACRRALEKDAG